MPAKLPPKPKRGANNKIWGNGVIYARYSSHAQKDISIEQQVEKDQELADSYGIKISEVYADRAVTGKTDKRPQFQRMLQDAANKKFSYVLAWKSNRIGRDMMEALINEAKLAEFGVRILYVEEDFDDSAAGRFAARSMMNVNQFYSENMAEDIRRGLQSNASNCMVTNGSLPFGYKHDENLKYVTDPPKDDIVREIFQRVASGEPFVDIGNDLNQRGVRTSHGNEWNKNSFHRMLKNERYRGVYIYGDIRVEGGVPRIVSDELFFKVQEVLKMKKNPQGRHRVNGDYILTGKLFCGECGKPMVGISGTGKNGTLHYYYACRGKITKQGCKKHSIRRDLIELEVAKAIKNYVLQEKTMNWIADLVEKYQKENKDAPELEILQSRLEEVTKSIKNIMKAIEEGIFTSTTKDRLEELEAEKKEISANLLLFKASHKEITRDQIYGWLDGYRNCNIEDKKVQADLFRTFLSAVYLYDDSRVKIVFGMGSPTEQSVSLELIRTDNSVTSECSHKLSFSPPCLRYKKDISPVNGSVMDKTIWYITKIPLKHINFRGIFYIL